MTKSESYDPEVELAKGAELTVAFYDETQHGSVTAGKVTVGGRPGVVEITGLAAGGGAMEGAAANIWLSIFRFTRPDGTTNHVAGLNVAHRLKPGQAPLTTAKTLADLINASRRPYRAEAAGDEAAAAVTITYAENG